MLPPFKPQGQAARTFWFVLKKYHHDPISTAVCPESHWQIETQHVLHHWQAEIRDVTMGKTVHDRPLYIVRKYAGVQYFRKFVVHYITAPS